MAHFPAGHAQLMLELTVGFVSGEKSTLRKTLSGDAGSRASTPQAETMYLSIIKELHRLTWPS